jgi:leukotriene-A4 hydrolase
VDGQRGDGRDVGTLLAELRFCFFHFFSFSKDGRPPKTSVHSLTHALSLLSLSKTDEGFTVLLERKIVAAVRGPATADLAAAAGAAALRATVLHSFGPAHPFTALVPDLSGGVDPDDAFSKVPYEKGFALLTTLERLVGGPPAFEPWLKEDWIAAWSGRAAATDDFVASFTAAFGPGGSRAPTPAVAAAVAAFDWEAWLRAPGLPPSGGESGWVAHPPTSLGAAADALADAWAAAATGTPPGPPPDAAPGDIAGWPADQVAYFLDALAERRGGSGLPPASAAALGDLYGLAAPGRTTSNAELRCGFLVLALAGAAAARCAPRPSDMADAAGFLREQGRMKYVRPLLRALASADLGAAEAALGAAAPGYHPITAKMAAADLAAARAKAEKEGGGGGGGGGDGGVATA